MSNFDLTKSNQTVLNTVYSRQTQINPIQSKSIESVQLNQSRSYSHQIDQSLIYKLANSHFNLNDSIRKYSVTVCTINLIQNTSNNLNQFIN